MTLAPSAIRRAGIVFAGGPAPGANAVIAAATMAFRRNGREVLGFMNGYASLSEYDPAERPLADGTDYFLFQDHHLRGLRNARGILVGTSRANPGKAVRSRADLADPVKTAPLDRVYRGLTDLGVDALVSIGGDDTLKTANLLYEYQRQLPAEAKKVRVVHVPKTIDNDYRGIDFTFGFFTAVDLMGKELLNLRADAMATKGYFIVETMGRKTGWLAYGVAIAGEAHMVVGVEDIEGELAVEEEVRDATGAVKKEVRLSLDALCDRIVDLILTRERRGKHYGTIVLAEGLAEVLPQSFLSGIPRDDHGHISLGRVDIGKLIAELAAKRFRERTGRDKKLTGVQLGYESRCAAPHAFDVMLGSQLGLGAYRALVDRELDGHMVSVTGQLDLQFVPFGELVDPETLHTGVRYLRTGSDFHKLARQLETRIEKAQARG
ncbi:MAG: 6-phosphofructokinase [Polyangiaceae bacterium]|nr:6-phosphofructokinase [Polyangiaceae bacterium]MCE7894651.1 6-phosphofructokinase [Sorangiineae bacterium PRO1]MCL4753925.1 6-phosphofructokinase [Myxococcales bacterium]